MFVNTIINYAVLTTAERLLRRKAKAWRIILASLVGALFAPAVFIDMRSAVLSVLIKVVSTLAICAAAFLGGSAKEFFRCVVMTLCVSFVFSGMMIAVYQLFEPPNMLIVNDIVYFDVSPPILLALTGAIYVLLCAVERILRERVRGSVVRLSFTLAGRDYACAGKVDTGCNLVEPFSGEPVIIADDSLLTLDESQGLRVIPYRTVGASSLLFAARAERVSVNGAEVNRSVYIAQGHVNNSAYQAIINSEIIR